MAKQMRKPDRPKKTIKQILTIAAVTLAALLFVGVGIYGLLSSSGVLEKNATVMVVGGEKIKTSEYNFHFYNQINNYITRYSSYIDQLGVDFSQPLMRQQYDESRTWADFFHDQTKASIENVIIMWKMAVERGSGLSDDSKAEVDKLIEDIKAGAKEYSLSFNDYARRVYGAGTTEKTIRHDAERYFLGIEEYQNVMDSYKFSNEELAKFYDEHQDEYNAIDYRLFYMAAKQSELKDEEQKKAENAEFLGEAKVKADEMLAGISNEADFIAQSKKYAGEDEKEYYEDESASLRTSVKKSSLSSALAGWLFDKSRSAMDKSVIEGPSGYYVVMLIKPAYKESYNLVNMRHILVSPEQNKETLEITDEAWEAAKEKIEKIKGEWETAGKTIEKFGELVTKNSEDTASVEAGGLYEGVYKKEMSASIDAWLFEAGRKAGDYEIIKTEYGYHLVYVDSFGGIAWEKFATDGLKVERFDEMMNETIEKSPTVVNKFGFSLVANK